MNEKTHSSSDPVTAETLRLSLQLLGDEFDPRVLCWHLRNKEGHLGYGQGQLLLGLLYADEREEFRARLQALFDVSHREVGDPYLMQEVLARPGMPNRGNKAALTYYPILIDMLAGINRKAWVDELRMNMIFLRCRLVGDNRKTVHLASCRR